MGPSPSTPSVTNSGITNIGTSNTISGVSITMSRSFCASIPDLDKPWREFDWTLKGALKDYLENFTLDNPDVKDIKILVTGQDGAGKSSFINSINNAFQGRITSRVLVNSSGGDSLGFTQELKGFTIKSENKSLPFVFKDIMEIDPDSFAGSQTDDIINAVLRNVNDGSETLTRKDHQAACLLYVIAADTVLFTDDKLIDQLKIIRKRISEEGIPQVVVMTKVDEACPLVNKDLRKIYTSRKIKEKMELCSAKLGVPLSNIFPVKNYHNEINTDDDIDVLILKALEQIVQIAKK